MSNRKVSSFTVRFFWPLMLCLGLGLMALVGLMSYRSDLHLASQNLTDATQYVKQQRTAYDRFNDTSMTKSLMRVIENAQQIDREIQYKIALTGEATLNTDDLRRYTYEQRLTGIILMNEHGVVQREYSTDGLDYAALRGYVTKDTVLGTAQFPIKTYTARIRLDDGSYVDLAAHGRTDEPGVIVVYYHTSAEYATDYNLIIQNLLEGYDPGTEETLVVTSGDSIIAANREGLAGQNVDDVPVLRSIRENAHGGEMTRVRVGSGDGEWVYCMLERGRDYYVYAYMPLTRAGHHAQEPAVHAGGLRHGAVHRHHDPLAAQAWLPGGAAPPGAELPAAVERRRPQSRERQPRQDRVFAAHEPRHPHTYQRHPRHGGDRRPLQRGPGQTG